MQIYLRVFFSRKKITHISSHNYLDKHKNSLMKKEPISLSFTKKETLPENEAIINTSNSLILSSQHKNLVRDIVVGQSLMSSADLTKNLSNLIARKYTKNDIKNIHSERAALIERRAELLMAKDSKYIQAVDAVVSKDKDDSEENPDEKSINILGANIGDVHNETDEFLLNEMRTKRLAEMMQLDRSGTKSLVRKEFWEFKAFKEEQQRYEQKKLKSMKRREIKKISEKLRKQGLEAKDYDDDDSFASSRTNQEVSINFEKGAGKDFFKPQEGKELGKFNFTDIQRYRTCKKIHCAILLFCQERATLLHNLTFGHLINIDEVVMKKKGHKIYVFWELAATKVQAETNLTSTFSLNEKQKKAVSFHTEAALINPAASNLGKIDPSNFLSPIPPQKPADLSLINSRLNKYSKTLGFFICQQCHLRGIPEIVFYHSELSNIMKEVEEAYQSETAKILGSELDEKQITASQLHDVLKTKKFRQEITCRLKEFVALIESHLSNISFLRKLEKEQPKKKKEEKKKRAEAGADSLPKKRVRPPKDKAQEFWNNI